MKRRLSLHRGAEITDRGVHFRLWAPGAQQVELVLEDGAVIAMKPAADGYYECLSTAAAAGSRYRYRIAGQEYPDPASRYQPDEALGFSEVVDPQQHDWQDSDWRTPDWHSAVLYELHVGSFSESGDFDGVIAHLDHLIDLGVNAIELMPVAECPGRWNWGYDGVLPFAVTKRYGGPAALKRLVDACHARGVAVMLDVVYNHFGPEGNFLHAYAPQFFTERHHTPWGAAINFDDEGSREVRDFFIENALYWLQEYHFDGLRFDAVHAIRDDSNPDFVLELGRQLRQRLQGRPAWLILENDENRASVLGEGYGGPGPFTAQWNDDYHHVLRVLSTNAEGGYYRDYLQHRAQRLGRVLAEGFDYQGETSEHRKGALRGEASASLPPTAFVAFIQNHDQVGNHAYGWRLPKFAPPPAIRAAAATLLLSPQVPMLWMGEEWASEQAFPFFCDFDGDLGEAVRQGRLMEFSSFPEFQDEAARRRIPDPLAAETFASAVLDWSAPRQAAGAGWLDYYRALIGLRREHLVPLLAGAHHGGEATSRVPGFADVCWTLAGGCRWRLQVNLAPQPATLGPGESSKTDDRVIFETEAPTDDAAWPAWFVRASLLQP
ncbi:MAG: malto-oligosyltrehalose trehalohydrolase [Gammaproteobacteria bacterium]|nr:malto-oligosyltrehalose trehalohydrolase [Gammaproteobacteria bacterium]